MRLPRHLMRRAKSDCLAMAVGMVEGADAGCLKWSQAGIPKWEAGASHAELELRPTTGVFDGGGEDAVRWFFVQGL